MVLTDQRQAIPNAIDAARDDLLHISREIHARPEIRYEEHFAHQLLSDALERYGFVAERGAGGVATAFVARKRGRADRPSLAFVAEYDALPGLGHGCGHNLIATAALAAGLGVGTVISEIEGMVLVIGTPAEEGGGGKIKLIEAGVFDGVDATLMVHPGSNMTFVPVEPGSGISLASQSMRFEFHGKAAHAAVSPAAGINALNAVLLMFHGIDSLRQHLVDGTRIHGIITNGGQATNIVPEHASCVIQMRNRDRNYLREVIEKVKNIAQGAALMTGARLEMSETAPMYEDTRPNRTLARAYAENLQAAGVELAPPGTARAPASTDYGNVSHRVPSCGINFAVSETPIPGHSREMVAAAISPFGEEQMLKVAKGMALTGYQILTEPDLLARAKAEHADTVHWR